jgi:uncharacterized protein (TIGR00252 family)
VTTFETGRRAEAVAANFLEYKGCTILSQNWRTRRCEIDIIAERDGVVYFCEVKYRIHNRQGSGLDYITPKKARQIRFAAEVWMAASQWPGAVELCVVEVSGPDFRITNVVKGIE